MMQNKIETLVVSKSSDGSATVVSRWAADGIPVAMYAIHQNGSKSKMEIHHGAGHPSRQQYLHRQGGSEPIATATSHFFSSSIDLSLHGVEFTMKRKNPLGGHSFAHPGLLNGRTVQWKRSSLLGSGLKLVDKSGRTIADYKERLGGFMGGGESGFHLHDSVEGDLAIDVVAVTGLAALEYKRQSDKDWDWLEEWI